MGGIWNGVPLAYTIVVSDENLTGTLIWGLLLLSATPGSSSLSLQLS